MKNCFQYKLSTDNYSCEKYFDQNILKELDITIFFRSLYKHFLYFQKQTVLVPPKLTFGLGLAAINEVRKRIYNIPDDIFVFFYQSDLRIEALTG